MKGTSPLQVIQKTIWLVLYFGEENVKNRLKLICGEISKKSSMEDLLWVLWVSNENQVWNLNF